MWLHPARGEWVEPQPRTAKLIHHLQNDRDAAEQGWPLVLRLEWASESPGRLADSTPGVLTQRAWGGGGQAHVFLACSRVRPLERVLRTTGVDTEEDSL